MFQPQARQTSTAARSQHFRRAARAARLAMGGRWGRLSTVFHPRCPGDKLVRSSMDTVTRLRKSAQLSALLGRLRIRLESTCESLRIPPDGARAVVMWGGGKDSTLALILASALS